MFLIKQIFNILVSLYGPKVRLPRVLSGSKILAGSIFFLAQDGRLKYSEVNREKANDVNKNVRATLTGSDLRANQRSL